MPSLMIPANKIKMVAEDVEVLTEVKSTSTCDKIVKGHKILFALLGISGIVVFSICLWIHLAPIREVEVFGSIGESPKYGIAAGVAIMISVPHFFLNLKSKLHIRLGIFMLLVSLVLSVTSLGVAFEYLTDVKEFETMMKMDPKLTNIDYEISVFDEMSRKLTAIAIVTGIATGLEVIALVTARFLLKDKEGTEGIS